MLTWQSNTPRFVAKGIVGDKMTFFFGCTNIDDIAIEKFGLVIRLLEHDGVWSVYAEWHQWSQRDRKPKVEGFISELNKALKTRQGFDFRTYWQDWSHKDSHFAAVIHDTRGDHRRVF